jgi:superfamily II DNA or RNA helicase
MGPHKESFTMGLEDFVFKTSYDSETDDIANDFYGPCLANSTEYWRASGYFSSTLFDVLGHYLKDFLNSEGKMKLITNIEFSEKDIEAIELAENSEQIAEDKIKQIIENEFTPPLSKGSVLMTKLLQMGRLEIKVAVKISGPGVYHEKIGIFFDEDYAIAITGSMNDGEYALEWNGESFDVMRPIHGDADKERISNKISRFKKLWSGKIHGTYRAYDWSEEATKKLIKKMEYTESGDYQRENKTDFGIVADPRFVEHQTKAINLFFEEYDPKFSESPMPAGGKGILCMATGSGKTYTALQIMERLFEENKIDQVIITTHLKDVCDQWAKKLEDSGKYPVFRQFDGKNQGSEFEFHDGNGILVAGRGGFCEFLLSNFSNPNEADKKRLNRTFLIIDECHNFRGETYQNKMDNITENFNYRLGLSATPESMYDSEANEFLYKSISNNGVRKPYFEFKLEDAIKRGILCSFNYHSIPYELSVEKVNERRGLLISLENNKKEKDPIKRAENEKILPQLIAKIHKLATSKPKHFERMITESGGKDSPYLKRCIIYCENIAYMEDHVIPIISKYTNLWKAYVGNESNIHLERFANKEIEVLIACGKLNEGIDIKSIKNIVMFSYTGADESLVVTQRIGRALRITQDEPNKKANIFDFYWEEAKPNSSEMRRKDWLSNLANIETEEYL